MLGLMQDWPLLCHRIIDHAAAFHAGRKVISRSVEGPIVETNYAEIRARALKVAKRLEKNGIKLGDRVATMAWNTARHLETWYGILGIGAVYHTVNPRLFPDQIAWIINHAEDRMMIADLTFVPLLEKHFLARPFQRPPYLDPPLQGAQLPIAVFSRMASLQLFQQRFAFQSRIALQLLL